MARSRERLTAIQPKTSDGIFPEFTYGWTPDIEDVNASYSRLSEGEITPELHKRHVNQASKMLLKAVNEYSLDGDIEKLNEVINKARGLTVHEDFIRDISFRFIDTAFNPNIDFTDDVREAVASIGTAIGGEDTLRREKVQYIARNHLGMNERRKSPKTEEPSFKSAIAGKMFENLGVKNVRETPSSIEYIKTHAKPITMAGLGATVLSSVIFNPVAAAAAENHTAVSRTNVASDEATVKGPTIVAASEATQTSTVAEVSTAIAAPTEETNTVEDIVVSAATTTESGVSTIETNIAAPTVDEKGKSTAIEPVTVSAAVETTAPATITTAVAANASAEKQEVQVQSVSTAKAAVEAVVGDVLVGTPKEMVDENGKIVERKPVIVSAKPEFIAPRLDPNKATKQELALEEINYAIMSDRNISAAAALIREKFGTNNPYDGKPVNPTSNEALVKHVTGSKADKAPGLQEEFMNKIANNKFHSDGNYINNTITALAVLEAAAYDQTVLDSPEVQQLLTYIKKPEDPYMGKLFANFVPEAKKILGANDGAMLVGIDQDKYKGTLVTIQTFIMLANLSDADQNAKIKEIKAAEAAEAARKLAEEAANGNFSTSPEAQALKNLIEREGDPALKRGFYIMQQLMAKTGLNAVRVSGIMGNLSVESASTFDPSVDQSNYGGGNAKGIAQWEASRFVDLQNFASARGTSWNDMDTQIAFLIQELPYQGDIINRLNGVDNIFDSAAIFLRGFERPLDQSDSAAQRRADRGQFFLNAFKGEVRAVNEARAAAEEERKKGLAESFDEANMWADSTGMEIPGFVKSGNDTAFHNGEAYKVGLYEIPGTYDFGKKGPALVNARAIYQANAMFAQMRKDLELEVIYFNDSYRTMEGQEEAHRRDTGPNGEDYGGAADPGHSAHQSGYAFDVNMGKANGESFDPGYRAGINSTYPGNRVWEWLVANAHKYHFKQWGPEGWHWSINGR